jgi:pimeloyl-ACP methyl ester carboxylesterase
MDDDLVLRALDGLMPGGVRRGELPRGSRTLRWIEAGSGEPVVVLEAGLGEPGSLVWAGVASLVAAHTRVIAYDRAGAGFSDPSMSLTLDGMVGDLVAVIESAGGRCVVAGHSWGGLLAQVTARCQPELIAGLVLVDPSDERCRAGLSPADQRENAAVAELILDQHARGVLTDVARDTFRPYALVLTPDPQLQALILDAYASCHARRSQAEVTRDEDRLFTESLLRLTQIRKSSALPRVPVTILSATTGMPDYQRRRFTGLHADLAATAPDSTHVELADTGHNIAQEKPGSVADAILRVLEAASPATGSGW